MMIPSSTPLLISTSIEGVICTSSWSVLSKKSENVLRSFIRFTPVFTIWVKPLSSVRCLSTPFCYKISDIFFSRSWVVIGIFWLESESLSFEFRISACLSLSSSASNTEPFLPFNRSVIIRLGIAFNAV